MPSKSHLAKLYVGPMSKNIVDAVISYNNTHNDTVGLIASRRQIDNNDGYVNGWVTKEFSKYVRSRSPKTIICRDHGGIDQGRLIDYGSVSFVADSMYLDIIHIDPFKGMSFDTGVSYIIDMIIHCCKLSDTVMFEVGTEEAVLKMSSNKLDLLLGKIEKKIPKLFNRIVYAVVQSGTKICGGANIGKYDKDRFQKMLDVCRKFGVMSKEHNGDYIPVQRLQEEFSLGLDAINIAPELANIESGIILDRINEDKKIAWFHLLMADGQWKKWYKDGFNPDQNRDNVLWLCGHYVFSNENFKKIIDLDSIKEGVSLRVSNFIDARI